MRSFLNENSTEGLKSSSGEQRGVCSISLLITTKIINYLNPFKNHNLFFFSEQWGQINCIWAGVLFGNLPSLTLRYYQC